MSAKGESSELLANLCEEVGAKAYLSGTGGKNYLDEELFRQKGIDIQYDQSPPPLEYPQPFPKLGFINSLSYVDMMFCCGKGWKNFLP